MGARLESHRIPNRHGLLAAAAVLSLGEIPYWRDGAEAIRSLQEYHRDLE